MSIKLQAGLRNGSIRSGRRAGGLALLVVGIVAYVAAGGGAHFPAGGAALGEQAGLDERSSGAAFDSPFDGVWVGIIDTKTTSGRRPYPVLLNLDVRDTGGSGLLLLANDLHGSPSSLEFLSLGMQLKGKKLTLGATRGEDDATEQLAAKLRIKGDVLKGTLTSSDEEFAKSRVEMRRLDPEEPLQHFWSGSVPSARGASEQVALVLWFGKKIEGGGFVGSAFGDLAGATLEAGRLTGTLKTPAGDIDLDLMIGRKGQLGGFVDGRPLDDGPLAPGNTAATPSIRKLTPANLPAGVTTTVVIKGKALAPGFLLHADVEGVYASPPQVQSARKATVAITVDAAVAAGTAIQLSVAPASGGAEASKARLQTSGLVTPNFLDNIQPIFAGTCGVEGCHAQPPTDDPAYPDGMAAGGMVLSGIRGFANTVNAPSTERPELNRIEPGDPERSYLIKKIRGDADIVGDRMPQDGPPYLSPEVIDMFIRWVEAGAPRSASGSPTSRPAASGR